MVHRVFVDANVLFSKTLRDWVFLLRIYGEGMFQLHSSEDVLAEAVSRLRDKFPTAGGRLTKTLIDHARDFLDEIIDDFSADLASFSGNDEGDHHVHAAALAAQANIILTCDTPAGITTNPDCEPYEIYHPDEFLLLVADSNPEAVAAVAAKQFDYWAAKPGSKGLSVALRNAGCPKFAERVRRTLRSGPPAAGANGFGSY